MLVVSEGKFVLHEDLSGNLKINLGDGLEKRIGLEETQSLCGFLNNKDVGKLCGSAEPRVKSCVLPLWCCCCYCCGALTLV